MHGFRWKFCLTKGGGIWRKNVSFLQIIMILSDTLAEFLQKLIQVLWLTNHILLAYRLSRASHLVKEKGETLLQLAYLLKVNGYTALVKTGLCSYVIIHKYSYPAVLCLLFVTFGAFSIFSRRGYWVVYRYFLKSIGITIHRSKLSIRSKIGP